MKKRSDMSIKHVKSAGNVSGPKNTTSPMGVNLACVPPRTEAPKMQFLTIESKRNP